MTEKQNIQREPLVRLAKRDDLSGAKKWAIRLVAIVLALVVGSLFIAVLGHNPIAVYHDIITGSLGGPSTAKVTVRVAIPLLGAALAIAPAFKMKFWNIGAEGQIMVGGIAATYFALYWYDKLPKPALLIVMAVASILAGGIWGLVPAFCKARWGTNETLFTLMLNYIAIGIEAYLQNGPWKDPSGTGFPIIAMFDQKARLPKVGGVHIGWIIVLALTVGMFIYMKYSKHGYEISVVGESQRTARYAGMNVGKIIMRTMFLSGAIAGLGGAVELLGKTPFRLAGGFGSGFGFDGVAIALIAQLNPIASIVVALLFGILSTGGTMMQSVIGVPTAIVDIIRGLIIIFAVAGMAMVKLPKVKAFIASLSNKNKKAEVTA